MFADMAISLVEAIKSGDEKKAKLILQQRAYTNIDKQGARGDGTALFWSCCKGYLELVHLLILHGACVDGVTAWGATALHASVDNNQLDVVDLLIRFGADVNKQTNNGDTPCHLASYRGYGACVQRLAEEGADTEIYNNKLHRPIEEAMSRGHYHIYEYLLAVQQIVRKCKSKQSTGNCMRQLRKEPVFQTKERCQEQTTPEVSDDTCSNHVTVTSRRGVHPGCGHAVGVLRLQAPPSFEYSRTASPETSINDLSSVNDLSSLPSECSEYSTMGGTRMSFKNIQ